MQQAAAEMQEQPPQQKQQQPDSIHHERQIILPAAFLEDPGGFLVDLASQTPTSDGLEKLAGPVAKWFISAASSANGNLPGDGGNMNEVQAAIQVAPLYLQAAAVQLRGYDGDGVAPSSSAASASAGAATASRPITNRQNQSSIQQEMKDTKNQYQVLEAVGSVSSSLCQERRAIFAILPTLSMLMIQSQKVAATVMNEVQAGRDNTIYGTGKGNTSPRSQSSGIGIGSIADAMFGPSCARTLGEVAETAARWDDDDADNKADTPTMALTSLPQFPPLQQVCVEFLQCAVAAEQYRYAARMVEGTWPRPTSTVNVKTVLRYFYLRGIVHLGCQDYIQAHRCWWACLSIPSTSESNDACSAIAVAAWKKMVLVQTLIYHRSNRKMTQTTTGSAKASSSNTLPPMPKAASKALTKKVSTDEACAMYATIYQAVCKGDVKTLHSLLLRPASPGGGGDGENTSMMDADGSVAQQPAPSSAKQSAHPFLAADGNCGLAQECLKRARCNQVWQMSQLYSAVSFEQLSRRWDIPVGQVAGRLMEASTVDGPRGTTRSVRFHLEQPGACASGASHIDIGRTVVVFEQDEEEDIASNGGVISLAPSSFASLSDLGDWMKLLERVQLLDVSIGTNSKYYSLTKRDSKSGTGGSRASDDVGMRDADNVAQAFGPLGGGSM